LLKLLVVDDEYNIREGLAKAVDWKSIGVEVVATASSGMDAMGCYDRLEPDIVITDIFMDEMNGLELVEAISSKNRNVKFILISGYDEFEYARKAIDLKVYRYLLKPVSPEMILSDVKAVADEIQEERALRERLGLLAAEIEKSRDILLRQFLHDVLHGCVDNADEMKKFADVLSIELPGGATYACVVLEPDGGIPSEDDFPYREARMLSLAICRIAEEVFRGFDACWSYPDYDNRVFLIPATRRVKEMDIALSGCIERLQKIARQNLGITVSAGIGNHCASLADVSQSRKEALRALEYKMVSGRESCIRIRDVQAIDPQRLVYPNEEEQRIFDAMTSEDPARLAESVNAFFRILSLERMQDNRIKAAIVKLYGDLAMKLNELGVPVLNDDMLDVLSGHDTLESVREWFLATCSEARKKLSLLREEGMRSIIRNSEKYIRSNFKDMELSLSLVADHLGLTPSYFSRLFKQETGSTYIDYVIGLRIEQAKRLLRTTTSRIFDIGEMVGYPNSQYFCTLFRKVCGVSPVEYREGREPG
jgi:two-component system, response regulator YesN